MKTQYYDPLFLLLGIEPKISARRVEKIEAIEKMFGFTLPASIREFYSLGEMELTKELLNDGQHQGSTLFSTSLSAEEIFYEYSEDYLVFLCEHYENFNCTEPYFYEEQNLRWVELGFLKIAHENQGCWTAYIKRDGSEDPEVLIVNDDGPYFNEELSDKKNLSFPPKWAKAGSYSHFIYQQIKGSHRFSSESW